MLYGCPACCPEVLDTRPSDKTPVSESLNDVQSLQTLLNGIYRAMYMNAWSTAWSQENPGIMAMTMVKDLQGEDHLMSGQGNGWFWYDYTLETDADFAGTNGRQFAFWSMFYTLIAQVNLVLSNEAYVSADSLSLPVLAQAYAIRAFAYTCLYECFCRGYYPLNSCAPGVPVYTEVTQVHTQGRPRTRADSVLMQIDMDFQKAAELFQHASSERAHPSHIDLYACYGLWARMAMIRHEWNKVDSLSHLAMSKPGLQLVASIEELGNFNDLRSKNVLWGFQVVAEQTSPYGPFLSHIDPEGGYGQNAFQCIDAWLFSNIPETDLRRFWWESPENYNYFPFCQLKFRYADPSSCLGDVIYLRAEELLLMAAEASCHNKKYLRARELLLQLGVQRDACYASRLSVRQDSDDYNSDTHGEITTLMDEILFQRRIELWSEGMGRCYDLRRLNLGYNREYAGTNHSCILSMASGDYRYEALIPQKEIDSNQYINTTDQNPR